MRLILVVLLVAMLAIPAAAVGGQTGSSSSQAAAAQSAAKVSKSKKGKQRKRKQQHRRGKAQKARGAATAQASSTSSSSVDDEVEVKGPIVSLSPLTVRTTTCVVPAGFSLVGFAVGDVVEMTCDLVAGQWVLRKLERENAPRGRVKVEGVVSSLSPLTVAGVSCSVPAGKSLTGIAVGDVVEMRCKLVGGVWVVTRIELEDDEDEDDDDNSGPGHGDDDDDDNSNSGPGHGDDDDDNSGPGGGDDD